MIFMSYPLIINNCSTSTNLRACDWNVTPMKINSLIYIDNIDIIVQQIKILIFKIVFLILKNLILCAKSQRYLYMYHTTPWRNHIVSILCILLHDSWKCWWSYRYRFRWFYFSCWLHNINTCNHKILNFYLV